MEYDHEYLDVPLTRANPHVAGETRRLYQPGEPVHVPEGCYVDGGQTNLVGLAQRSAGVAYGIGALDAKSYGAVMHDIAVANHWDDGEAIDAITDRIVDALNDACEDASYVWAWENSDLMFSCVDTDD